MGQTRRARFREMGKQRIAGIQSGPFLSPSRSFPMHLTIEQERMSDFFMKHHVRGLPRPVVVHELGADHGDPHDHPFAFNSFVAHGGYTEEAFDLATGESRMIRHDTFDSFRIEAGHIHRVVQVDPETITFIMPHGHERKPGFCHWDQDGTAYHRFHDQPDFTPIKAAGQDESRAVAA